jgi:DNA invertase Pin-like site-specific DNA recombinase
MRPAIYVRVSSADQVAGFSLDSQRRLMTEYCTAQGWPAPQVFADEGVSAYTDEIAHRPAFAAALAAAESDQIDLLVTLDLDRFARSTIVALTAAKRLERAGVPLVSLNQTVDHTTPDGRVLFTVNAAFAEYASAQISRKTRAGLAQKRHAGLHVGGVPFGARRVAGRLDVDPARAPALARLLELAATESAGTVAAMLTAEGVPLPKRGSQKPYWHISSVESIVKRGSWLLDQPEPWPARWRAARERWPLVALRRDIARAMLSGLMRCPCGGYITQHCLTRDGRSHFLRCRNYTSRPRGSGCPFGRHRMSLYEAQLVAWVAALPLVAEATVTLGDTAAEHAALAEQRRLLWKGLETRGLTEAEYDARIADLDAQEAALPPPGVRTIRVTPALLAAQAAFLTLAPAGQNALLRQWLARVLIAGEHAVPIMREDFAQLVAACRSVPPT